MTLHMLKCKQEDCICGGYHYKHRRGSPLCEANPMSAVLLASRQWENDDTLADIAADIAFNTHGKPSAVCPF